MNATDTNTTPEAANAAAALVHDREVLAESATESRDAMTELRRLVVLYRPAGILTVDEMAVAIDRDRNFIDTVWNAAGGSDNGRPTRVKVTAGDQARAQATSELSDAASALLDAVDAEDAARRTRNHNVARIYGQAIKGFGPSAIAAAAGIDRNHVLRCARKAGVGPAWRPVGTSRNQHSK